MTRLAALALAVGMCLGAAACSDDAGDSGPSADTALAGTQWRLVEVAGGEKASGKLVAVPNRVTATAVFDGTRISGSGGCNRYGADYSTNGDEITIGEIASTLIGCDDPAATVEVQFLAALDAANRFAISDDTLTLSVDDRDVARMTRTAAPTLTGTEWQATSINNGKGAVQSIVEGTKPTAVFGTDGTVSGNAGCNTFKGSYTISDDRITIRQLSTTKRACTDDDATRQEAAYLKALERSTTVRFVDASLELRDDDGALQVGFVAGAPATATAGATPSRSSAPTSTSTPR